MKNKITNIGELTAEITRLKIQKKQQEEFLLNQYDLLRAKVSAPARIMNLFFSRVPGVGTLKGLLSGIGGAIGNSNSKGDWLTRTLQLGLPLVLNKTLLRNAGWIKKAVVLFASESAASNINKAKITSVIDSITSFIKPKKKRKKTPKHEFEIVKAPLPANHPPMITAEESVQDNIYGIPKDSEAY